MNKDNSTKKYTGIIDILKAKLIEAGTEYFKENINKTKKQVFKYVEKNIETKIKKEIKKNLIKLSSYIFLGVAGIFLLYGILDIIVNLLLLPIYLTNIFFGLILGIIGLIFYFN